MSTLSDTTPLTDDISRSDVGINIAQFGVPFAVAAALAVWLLRRISFTPSLLGSAFLQGRHRTSIWLKNSVIEQTIVYIQSVFLVVQLLPPMLLVAWGFYTYHHISHLYGLTIALIGLAFYFLACAIEKWKYVQYRSSPVVKLLFTASLLLLIIFEVWMLALARPVTFVGVSSVLLAFNVVPVAYVAMKLTDEDGGGGGESDDTENASSTSTDSFLDYPHVREEMRKARAKVEVMRIRVTDQYADDEENHDQQDGITSPSSPGYAGIVMMQNRAHELASPSTAVVVSMPPTPADASSVQPQPLAGAVVQAAPSSINHPSLFHLLLVYVFSLLLLFVYALIIHFTIEENEKHLGWATIAAIIAIDAALLSCLISAKIKGLSILWYALLSRGILLIFGAQYYFLSHSFLFFLVSCVGIGYALDSVLGEVEEKEERVKREAWKEVGAGRVQGQQLQSQQQQEDQPWFLLALRSSLAGRCCTCLSPSTTTLLHNLPLLTLVTLTLLFTLDLLISSQYARATVRLGETHVYEQWFIGLMILLLSIFLGLLRVMIRIYALSEYTITWKLILVGSTSYALLLSCSISFYFLSIYTSYLAFLLTIFFPPFLLNLTWILLTWISVNDYTWFSRGEERNPPHVGFGRAFVSGGLQMRDYGMIGSWIFFFVNLILFGLIIDYTSSSQSNNEHVIEWWYGYLISACVFILLTTILPIVEWFGRLEVTKSIVIFSGMSISSFVLSCYLVWYYILSSSTSSLLIFQIILFMLLYPMVVMFVTGWYKWYDDRWRMSTIVKFSLTVSVIVVVMFFLTIAATQEPWEVGASLVILFSITVFFITYLPYVHRWSPRVAKLLLIAGFTIVLVFALSVGFTRGTGFLGLTIGWMGSELILILIAWNVYYPITASESASSSPSSSATNGLDPTSLAVTSDASHTLYIYSPFILPVWKFEPDANMIALGGGSTASNHIFHLSNIRVLCIYFPLFSAYIWSTLSVYFIDPPVIGLGISSLCIVATVVYSVQVARYAKEQVREVMKEVMEGGGDESMYDGDEGGEDGNERPKLDNDERKQLDGSIKKSSSSSTPSSLYLSLLRSSCSSAALAQFGRRALRRQGATAHIERGMKSVSKLDSGVKMDQVVLNVGPSSSSSQPGKSVTYIHSAADADVFLEGLYDTADGDDEESADKNAKTSTQKSVGGGYTWQTALQDFDTLSANIPWPRMCCGVMSCCLCCKSSKSPSSRSSHSSYDPSTRSSLIPFHHTLLTRISAYFILARLHTLLSSLFTKDTFYLLSIRVELKLRVEKRKTELVEKITEAVKMLKEKGVMGGVEEEMRRIDLEEGKTGKGDVYTSSTETLSPSLLHILLSSPSRRALLFTTVSSITAASAKQAALKLKKRQEEQEAQERRDMLVQGRKQEVVERMRMQQEERELQLLQKQEEEAARKLDRRISVDRRASVDLRVSVPKITRAPSLVRSSSLIPADTNTDSSIDNSDDLTNPLLLPTLQTKALLLSKQEQDDLSAEEKRKQSEWLLNTKVEECTNDMQAARAVIAQETDSIQSRANTWSQQSLTLESTHLLRVQSLRDSYRRLLDISAHTEGALAQAKSDPTAERSEVELLQSEYIQAELALSAVVGESGGESSGDSSIASTSRGGEEMIEKEIQAHVQEMQRLDQERQEKDEESREKIEHAETVVEKSTEKLTLLHTDLQAIHTSRSLIYTQMESDLTTLDPVLQQKKCTFSITGERMMYQKWFTCVECESEREEKWKLKAKVGTPTLSPKSSSSLPSSLSLNQALGFCESCRQTCQHSTHSLRTHFSRFWCHCGWKESKLGGGKKGGKKCCKADGAVTEVTSTTTLSLPPHISTLPAHEQLRLITKACEKTGQKWTDPDFTHDEGALWIDPEKRREEQQQQQEDGTVMNDLTTLTTSGSKKSLWSSLIWARASDIHTSPSLFLPPLRAETIKQGLLGDCYLISALAVLTLRPSLIQEIFINTQYEKYGIYAVRFWKNGKRRTVLVDDWLPYLPPAKTIVSENVVEVEEDEKKDEEVMKEEKDATAVVPAVGATSATTSSSTPNHTSAFGRSLHSHELWVSLIEKAAAKMHMSYEAIESGCVDTSLVDLTGGVGDRISLTSPQTQQAYRSGTLWMELTKYFSSGYLLGCGSPAGHESESVSLVQHNGIIQNHAYSILDVRTIDGGSSNSNNTIRLIKLRNPWARYEWTGKYSDYDTVSWTARLRKKVNFVAADDGSFWMCFEDWMKEFDELYLCRFFDRNVWKYYREIPSVWQGITAGGNTSHYSVVHSPQWLLHIRVPCDVVIMLEQYDDDDEVEEGAENGVTKENGTTHTKAKENRHRRKPTSTTASLSSSYHAIGLEVYDNNSSRVSRRRRGKLVAQNPSSFSYRREVTAQFTLPILDGDRKYTVLAATLMPGEERRFRLQVYATQPIGFELLPPAT